MYFRWILVFCYLTTISSTNETDFCQRKYRCQNSTDSCHSVVMKCRNDSCDHQLFDFNDPRRKNVSNWFFDPDKNLCRLHDDRTDKLVVTFQDLDDCNRFCLKTEPKMSTNGISSSDSEEISKLDQPVIVHLQVDISTSSTSKPIDQTTLSKEDAMLAAQIDYFQKYRRRFPGFVDAPYQFWFNRARNNFKSNGN